MPIYKCYSRKGLLTESARQQITKEITTIHCEATGAPPSFVNVMFLGDPRRRIIRRGPTLLNPFGH